MKEPKVLPFPDGLCAHDGAFLIEYNLHRINKTTEWAFLQYISGNWAVLAVQNNNKSDITITRYRIESYNKTWRCWDFRPTSEQMESVPWWSEEARMMKANEEN